MAMYLHPLGEVLKEESSTNLTKSNPCTNSLEHVVYGMFPFTEKFSLLVVWHVADILIDQDN